jgi:hypothetical protein
MQICNSSDFRVLTFDVRYDIITTDFEKNQAVFFYKGAKNEI